MRNALLPACVLLGMGGWLALGVHLASTGKPFTGPKPFSSCMACVGFCEIAHVGQVQECGGLTCSCVFEDNTIIQITWDDERYLNARDEARLKKYMADDAD
jgi:hypothetical protein